MRAKIADFGFSSSRSKRDRTTGSPYHMAPELLRGLSSNTTFSDVYSFGILLWEVYARADPYEGESFFRVLDEIVDPNIKRRPPVPPDCPIEMRSIMEGCLEDNPELRPTFEEMDIRLRGMCPTVVSTPEGSASMSDIHTDATVEPKQKELTDKLLEEVFPPHVAEALREGRKVQPESRELVTILFIDIVGFTTLASTLSPMKVSNMLDRLYTHFDNLSHEHDVFKVREITVSVGTFFLPGMPS